MVNATEPKTDIWLVDDHWHPVQKASGTLKTSVLAGRYFIEIGAAGPAYAVELTSDKRLTQQELEAGPSLLRQAPILLDDADCADGIFGGEERP